MREADLQRCIANYLTYLMNQGKLYFDRLNSGSVLVKRGDKTYRVELCREGTADFMVIRTRQYFRNAPQVIAPEIIFLELKGDKGKQSQAQKDFQDSIEAQGTEYHVIRSIQELEEILETD